MNLMHCGEPVLLSIDEQRQRIDLDLIRGSNPSGRTDLELNSFPNLFTGRVRHEYQGRRPAGRIGREVNKTWRIYA